MTPEDLLHLFGPFLPTDRFRALLSGRELPTTANGAALLVDMSGFTPLAASLVTTHGQSRASEELKRRLNPMLEATAGQVFQHGGSVIRFVGDGFLAWFDDSHLTTLDSPVSAVLRATAAAYNMQSMMSIFRDLSLRIAIGPGLAYRWVVGQARHGLNDVLSGPAVEAMVNLIDQVEPGKIILPTDAHDILTSGDVRFQPAPGVDGLLIQSVPDATLDLARLYRWPAWQIEADGQTVVDAIRPYVASALRDAIEDGFSDFVGELRQAFPMFIRVNGLLTTTASETDPRLALDKYVRDVQDVLAETGGRLVSVEVSNKGSVLFAVFGAPVTYGDDAERALSAAMIFRDLSVANGGNNTEFRPQIGISRGPLYAGVVGGEVRHEYSTIGDETNVAARLMAAARPGQILVTSRVQDEVMRRIAFRDLGSILVKGKEEPIAVSEPLALSREISRYTNTKEMIGRHAEVTQFKNFLKAVQSGLPRIVQIEGQAGIGKSRLVQVFGGLATAQQFRTVNGECLNTGRNTPYLPWRKLLNALFDLTADMSPPLRAERLTAQLIGANPEWLLRLPLLGDLLQVALPGNSTLAVLPESARQQALSTIVIELIVHFSRQQPLMIMVENVQWIDELSENILIDLARFLSVEPVPVLLTLTHRPLTEAEQGLDFFDLLAEMYIFRRLVIGDLSRDEVNQFVEYCLEAPPPSELTRFVYDQARGNPFFIQELLDTLEETKAIQVHRHRVTIQQSLDTVALPRTVQGLIQARIDRLGEGDKLVLKIASVIGRQFQVRILAACVPSFMSQAQLLTHLQTLAERDFIQQEIMDSEPSYIFTHALTHEVAYQGLLFAQRRQLHQSVGMALEALQPTNIQQLAFHFAHSGDENRGRALRYLREAAQIAMHEYANQAALDYLEQALGLVAGADDLFDIHQRRIDVLLRIGAIEPAAAELAEVQWLAEAHRRSDWIAPLHVLRARYYASKSDWQSLLSEANEALTAARKLGNDLLIWEALLLLSEAYRSLGDPQADEILRRDVRIIAERLNDPQKDVQLLLKEIADLAQYHPDSAMYGARNLLSYAESLDDMVLVADCWALIAELAQATNDLPVALDAFRQQLTRVRRIGNRRREGQTLNNLGLLLINMAQFSEANACLQQAYSILNQIGERRGRAIGLNGLGIIANYRGAYDEALAYLSRGLEQMRELAVPGDIALTLLRMGDVHLRMADPNGAEQYLTEALALFEKQNWSSKAAEARTALGEAALQKNEPDQAQILITELLPALIEGRINGLEQPGLAYWRAILVLERTGQSDTAVQLRTAYARYFESIVVKLTDPTWREAYTQIWYHKALNSAFTASTSNAA